MKLWSMGAVLCLGMGLSLHAAPVSATASLTNFLQDGSITNNAVSANIVQVVYSLGPAGDGISTWDGSSGTDGGTPSDFLSAPNWFQTITWSGLSVAPGGSFSFGGLDIDLIVTLAPLDVTGAIIGDGPSLVGAYVRVLFDDGQIASAALLQQDWGTDQTLTLNADAAVPEPSAYLMISSALGLLAMMRRKR
jgi:hypothetical protein